MELVTKEEAADFLRGKFWLEILFPDSSPDGERIKAAMRVIEREEE